MLMVQMVLEPVPGMALPTSCMYDALTVSTELLRSFIYIYIYIYIYKYIYSNTRKHRHPI